MFPNDYPNLRRAAKECSTFNDLDVEDVLQHMADAAMEFDFTEIRLAERFAGCLPDDILTEFAAGDYAEDDAEMLHRLASFQRGMTDSEWARGRDVFDVLLDASF